MAENYLYIVFSSTPYRMGKLLRKLTGETYNHLSVALDENLTQMYGFARRYYRTPFYGGFVRESTSRYRVRGEVADILLCRIPVPEGQYRRLSQQLSAMYAQKERYLYNYLTVFTAPFGRTAPVKDAYICTEFGAAVLQQAGLPVNPKNYYSVGKLAALLQPYIIYAGPIPEPAVYDEAYYAAAPIPHPVLTSVRCFLALLLRKIC